VTVQAQHRRANGLVRDVAHAEYIAPAIGPGRIPLSDRIAAGRAIQRLWLAATTLDLQMQPQYTPLVFARYAREHRVFTRTASAQAAGCAIERALAALLGAGTASRAVWLARIGPARSVPGRSLRRPLSDLIVDSPPAELPPLAQPAPAGTRG